MHAWLVWVVLAIQLIPYNTQPCRLSVEFDAPALADGVEYTGNIINMLSRLNLSSLQSNVQHLVTTLSGHASSSAADVWHHHPVQGTQQEQQALRISIGSRQSCPLQRAWQLPVCQAYISRGWAASHLQQLAQQGPSAESNLPLLELSGTVSARLQICGAGHPISNSGCSSAIVMLHTDPTVTGRGPTLLGQPPAVTQPVAFKDKPWLISHDT